MIVPVHPGDLPSGTLRSNIRDCRDDGGNPCRTFVIAGGLLTRATARTSGGNLIGSLSLQFGHRGSLKGGYI